MKDGVETSARLVPTSSGIGQIILDNPPANALGARMRADLMDALNAALADPEIKLILIRAEGRTFPSSVERAEIDVPQADPTLSDLCLAIEHSSKPVVVCSHGTALGAGCDLLLAGHYRAAENKSYVGLPEVTVGLPPSGGATQRLPRLVGPAVALELMLVGRPIAAPEAKRLGMIDEVLLGNQSVAALDYARKLLEAEAGPRPVGAKTDVLKDGKGFAAAVKTYRDKVANANHPAPQKIVEAVEAAQMLPYEVGLTFEAELHDECRRAPEGRAMRHVMWAEKVAGQMRLPKGTVPKTFETCVIMGGGASMAGWAIMALDAGMRVAILDDGAEAARDEVKEVYAKAIAAKRMLPQVREDRLLRLSVAGPSTGALSSDLVIQTDAAQGKATQERLNGAALLCVGLPLGQAGDFADYPAPNRVVGVQLADRPHLSKLFEVLHAADTDLAALSGLVVLLRKLGKHPVLSRASAGGIGSSVWGACMWAAEDALKRGATRDTVLAAFRDYGFTRNPLRSGAVAHPTENGRVMPADEIIQRCLAAMANTGALLVEAGIAHNPLDIDLTMVSGYGFPKWKGGPMQVADEDGLMALRRTLRALQDEDAGFWSESGLITDLIKNGQRFADRNRF